MGTSPKVQIITCTQDLQILDPILKEKTHKFGSFGNTTLYPDVGKQASQRSYGCCDTWIVASFLKVQWERDMWKC